MMHQYYTISELTREFGITTRTLRFYEDEGLLRPMKRGRTRLYTAADRTRLRQILRAKRLNFSLSEIAEMLSMYDDRSQDGIVLYQLLEKVNEKRAQLENIRVDIDDTLQELDRLEETCFERLAALGVIHRS